MEALHLYALIVVSSIRAGAEEQAREAHADHLTKTKSARDAERTRLPPYWTPIGSEWDGAKTLRVPLRPNSHEFQNVAGKFHSTCPPNRYTIEGVCRVQNFDQWGMFLALMKRMRARKSMDPFDPGANVQELFHGTDEAVVGKIVEHNFNRSFNKVGAHGAGVYFAREARYSANPGYSKPNHMGQQFMILTKVLVGHSTAGNRSMLEPPPRKLADGSDGPLYDSLEAAGGQIIVSCHRDYQAYAEHVITFRPTHGGPMPGPASNPFQQPPFQHPPFQRLQVAAANPRQRLPPAVQQYESSLGSYVQLLIKNHTANAIRITDHVHQTAGSTAMSTTSYDIAASSQQCIQVRQGQKLQAHALDMWNNPIGKAPVGLKDVNQPPVIWTQGAPPRPQQLTDEWIVGVAHSASQLATALAKAPPRPQQLKYSIPKKGGGELSVSVTAMAAGPNDTILTGHVDGSVRVIGVQTAALIAVLSHHRPVPVTAIAQCDGWLVWAYDSGEVIAQREGGSTQIVVCSTPAATTSSQLRPTTVTSLVFPRRVPGLPPVVVTGTNGGWLRAFLLDASKDKAEPKMNLDLLLLATAESGRPDCAVVETRVELSPAGMLGSADPCRVFAVCSLAAGSASGQSSSGVKSLPQIGCAICEWDLNAGDRAALKLIPNARLVPTGLQWHNGKLLLANSDGTVLCFAPDLTVARHFRLCQLKNGTSLTSFVAFGNRGVAASTTDQQIIIADSLPLVQPSNPTGRWILNGRVNGGDEKSKYSHYTDDTATDGPLGVRINSSGVVDSNGARTPFVAQGTCSLDSFISKAEWLSCMPGQLPVLYTGHYVAFRNPGVPDGTPCGLQGNRIIGKWEVLPLEKLGSPQLSFFHEAHVGVEIASAAFTPHQMFFPSSSVSRPSSAGAVPNAPTTGHICQRVVLGDLQYPPPGAFCDVCRAPIQPSQHFFHEGPATGGRALPPVTAA